MVSQKLDALAGKKKLVYYSSSKEECRANAAVLIGLFQIIYLGRHPTEAFAPLSVCEPFTPFRDASYGVCRYRLTVQHCLRSATKALKLGFLDFNNFNLQEYEHFEQVENGDLSVLVPNKFIAFAGPHATNVSPEGYPAFTPEEYVPILKKYGTTTIIRLNDKAYQKSRFTKHGFSFHDMYYPDGTTPKQALLLKFLEVCEEAEGTIAVHCKAGLGRTGSCIGCYLMKHYMFTAAEAIAWMRLCRVGCVIGPQQSWLRVQQEEMWRAGDEYRAKLALEEKGDHEPTRMMDKVCLRSLLRLCLM